MFLIKRCSSHRDFTVGQDIGIEVKLTKKNQKVFDGRFAPPPKKRKLDKEENDDDAKEAELQKGECRRSARIAKNQNKQYVDPPSPSYVPSNQSRPEPSASPRPSSPNTEKEAPRKFRWNESKRYQLASKCIKAGIMEASASQRDGIFGEVHNELALSDFIFAEIDTKKLSVEFYRIKKKAIAMERGNTNEKMDASDAEMIKYVKKLHLLDQTMHVNGKMSLVVFIRLFLESRW